MKNKFKLLGLIACMATVTFLVSCTRENEETPTGIDGSKIVGTWGCTHSEFYVDARNVSVTSFTDTTLYNENRGLVITFNDDGTFRRSHGIYGRVVIPISIIGDTGNVIDISYSGIDDPMGMVLSYRGDLGDYMVDGDELITSYARYYNLEVPAEIVELTNTTLKLYTTCTTTAGEYNENIFSSSLMEFKRQ